MNNFVNNLITILDYSGRIIDYRTQKNLQELAFRWTTCVSFHNFFLFPEYHRDNFEILSDRL